MPALAKCLTVVLLLTIPATAEAQLLPKLIGSRNTAQPAMSDFERRARVAPVQYEEALPSATSEVMPSSDSLPAYTNAPYASEGPGVPELLAPSQNAAPSYQDATPYVYESAASEYPVESMQAYEHSIPSDAILSSGQPYDMPISDAIASETAEIFSTNNWFRGGRWYSKQEFMLMIRGDLPHVHVAFDQSQNFAGQTFDGNPDVFQMGSFNTQDVDFTYEAGTKLTLGKILGRDIANRDHGIEFTFLGLFDYTGRSTVSAVNPESGFGFVSLLASNEARSSSQQLGRGVGFPVINAVPGFVNNTSQTMNYHADFNSMEFNYTVSGRPSRDRLVMQPDGRWVRHATPSRVRATYVGFRYIRQNELFEYTGNQRNGLDAANAQDPIEERGLYRVTTDNDLFGFQFGGEFVRKQTNWVFGVSGKLGGLLNFADRDSLLIQTTANTGPDDLVTETDRETLNDETLTFMVDSSVYLAYFVRPNTSFRMGYNAIYLNGMATATNNIGLISGFHDFELTGDSLYHGLNVGFEMTW